MGSSRPMRAIRKGPGVLRMKRVLVRLVAIVAGVVVVASCDTRLPTSLSSGLGPNPNTSGGTAPTVSIDTPVVSSLANVGDSVLVVARLHGTKSLRNVELSGLTISGSADLGTLRRTVRYTLIDVPATGAFRAGLHDTTVRRYLQPVLPSDTTLDSLIIQAIVTDSTGAVDTTTRRVDLVSGPRVTIIAPASGDSTPAGIGITVTATVADPDGVARVTVRVQGESSWPTKLDTSITQSVAAAPREATVSAVARIPINAPLRSRVTITASAVSVNGNPGYSGSTVVFVRGANGVQPLVTQAVATRSEISDSITVTVRGDGIAAAGYVARDSTGTILVRDSVFMPQPYTGNVIQPLSLQKLPVFVQGKRVLITGFAVDQSGRTGYAVRSTQLTPAASLAVATGDSTLIVYGHTFPLPVSRQGTVGDIVWDAPRENIVLSNMAYNRLEVFHSATKSFQPQGVAVGSMPWGLFISNDPNVLLVANSGGTNLSKVSLPGLFEIADQRVRTRGTYLFTVNENYDQTSQKLTEAVGLPIIYSDRPQYIGQLSDGTVYYSTRPTSDAPTGTIRYIDLTQQVPDPKPILVGGTATSITTHIVTNADNVIAISGAATNTSDAVVLCDHPPGSSLPTVCSPPSTKGLVDAVQQLKNISPGCSPNCTDIEIVDGIDITTGGLKDTTYVAVSGDRSWLAFGQGNTRPAGAVFMASAAGFRSPALSQADLLINADEPINGLALDNTGLTVAAHGTQSFFASVDAPFHLRLQGKYDNQMSGAGITFHPLASGSTGDASRTAYIASNNQTIDIVDVFHYLNRGHLPLKANLYGSLRAVLPGPSDSPDVVLKLIGISAGGLVVIDVRAGDILPSP